MKSRISVLLAACATAVFLSGGVQAASENSADITAIDKLEHAFGAATKYDHIERMFARDSVLLDVFTPGYYRGSDQFRAALEWQFSGMKSMDNTLYQFNVMHHGNLACAASVQRSVSVNQSLPDPIVANFVFTDVLRKVDGRWSIIVNHASFPIDPKTWDNVASKTLAETQPMVVHEDDWFPGPGIPVAQAKAELRKWANDLYAAQTADQAIRFYDPAVTLYTSLTPSVYHGRDQVLGRFREDMNDIKSVHVRERESGIETDGVLGVVWSLQDIDLVMNNGESQKLNMRQLDCLHRKDGAWLAVHEILSFPVDAHTWKGVPLLQYGDKPVAKAGTGNPTGKPVEPAIKQ